MKQTSKILSVLSLAALVSCGGSGGGSNNATNNTRQEMQASEGTYKAILRPYNFTVSGWIPNGVTDIKVEGDSVEIKSWLDDSANVTHMQNIHYGSECPGPQHDVNGDGYVDFKESQAVSGGIMMALDSNIEDNREISVFPKGNFTYFQKADLKDIANALGQNLAIENKVIIVMGSINKALPASISTVNGQSRELSVPIACGIIQAI